MNYIVLDLERNQPISAKRMIRTPVSLYGEIIQITREKRPVSLSCGMEKLGESALEAHDALHDARKWFKKMWQGVLDSMVQRLNDNGVEDTPYNDREW